MAFLFDAMAAALLVLGWFAPTAGDRWIHPIEQSLARFSQRKAPVVVSLGVATILIRLALLPVSPIPAPAIHDEFSYLLGADTFAHGRLTNPPHAMWHFFDTFHVLQHPTYASKYPPGPGAAMAIGQLLGHPWFGVLLSTAAMVMAMTWMLQNWVPPAWALLGGVLVLLRLGLLNAWFENYYSAGLSGAGAALVLGAFPRILKSHSTVNSLLLGTGAVLLACTRPFEGLLFCLPIGIVLAICLLRRPNPARAALLRGLAPAVVVLVAGCAFLAYYNARVTGSAFVFPWSLYLRQYFNSPIFVWQKPGLPLHYSNPQFEEFFNHWQHDRYTFIRSAWMKHASGTFWAWWYVFCGPVLTIPFLMSRRLLRDRRMRLPLLVFGVCAFGLISVVWFQPSYAVPLATAYLVLLVQAMRHLRHAGILGRPTGVYLTRLLVFLAIDWVVIQGVHAARHPVRDWNVSRVDMSATLAALPGQHLVLVSYGPSHDAHHEWVYNAADIDHAKIVWAREIPGQDLQPLLDYFKDRKIWVLEPDHALPELRPYPPSR